MVSLEPELEHELKMDPKRGYKSATICRRLDPESINHFGGNTIKGRFSSIYKTPSVEEPSSVFKKDGDRRREA